MEGRREVRRLQGRDVHDLVELFGRTHVLVLGVDLAELIGEVDACHEHFLREGHQLEPPFLAPQP